VSEPRTPAAIADVPRERLRRNPLLSRDGWALLERLLRHAYAPRWNAAPGDGVRAEDLQVVDRFRASLASWEGPEGAGPPPEVVARVVAALASVPLLRNRAADRVDPRRAWASVPTTSREDLATRVEEMVPDDVDLGRLVAHETSGTTGHAIHVPTHPQAIASHHALLEVVLARLRVPFRPRPGLMASVHLCCRARTWVFPAVFSVWREAGFAKVNLADADWSRGRASARAFFADFAPSLWAGDPSAFDEAVRWDLPGAPLALLSTATGLEPALARALERRFRCPVIDWYSTTETGPIAWRSGDGDGFEPIAPDLYVEAIDGEGRPVPEGEVGELAVSGGRNPYLPLVRYRTGDRGRITWIGRTGRGRTMRILDLQGRRAVRFFRDDGRTLDAADVGRELRARSELAQHALLQRRDGSFELRIRPLAGVPPAVAAVEAGMRELLGRETRLEVVVDPALGLEGKVVPYRCEATGPRCGAAARG